MSCTSSCDVVFKFVPVIHSEGMLALPAESADQQRQRQIAELTRLLQQLPPYMQQRVQQLDPEQKQQFLNLSGEQKKAYFQKLEAEHQQQQLMLQQQELLQQQQRDALAAMAGYNGQTAAPWQPLQAGTAQAAALTRCANMLTQKPYNNLPLLCSPLLLSSLCTCMQSLIVVAVVVLFSYRLACFAVSQAVVAVREGGRLWLLSVFVVLSGGTPPHHMFVVYVTGPRLSRTSVLVPPARSLTCPSGSMPSCGMPSTLHVVTMNNLFSLAATHFSLISPAGSSSIYR